MFGTASIAAVKSVVGIKATIGITAIGLLTLATPAGAYWDGPELASTGNLHEPSMATDSVGREGIVARGDTGIWYVTHRNGNFQRTRMTQDFTSNANGQTLNHTAQHPLIAFNAGDIPTVVYSMRVSPGSCSSQAILYTTLGGNSWSTPQGIPGTACETATGLVVHGAKIYLATIHGTSRVSYFTNASGAWTHVSVATATHISRASLSTYDGKPMLAYIKSGHLVYARGLTSTGNFVHEAAAAVDSSAKAEPSVAINPKSDWPMIVWAQSDGTHYAYRDSDGWESYRVMKGSVRALLAIDDTGIAHIVSADGPGGLRYAIRYSGAWHREKLDAHAVSDLGGITSTYTTVTIAYIRSSSHLYSVISYEDMGC
jgi:hypothetical protein